MTDRSKILAAIERFPRVEIAHTPTPIEQMKNLGSDLGVVLSVKRDDCTGIGFGGNKVRQLEFYFGAAVAERADTILITGAIQSNFVRTAAAFARRLDMDCHIQLEDRVDVSSAAYNANGNVFLDRILGATIHPFAEGENEDAADASLARIADELRGEGRRPFVIPLGIDHPPLGALGYVTAAIEVADQLTVTGPMDEIVLATGSALSHVGLLFGLRALEVKTTVIGICVRRRAEEQMIRIERRIEDLEDLLGVPSSIEANDIVLDDGALFPGYGRLNPATTDAILRTARREGLFLDPTYTGKAMAGLIELVDSGRLSGRRILFWHTGGQPALFGYADQLIQDADVM